jgi:hypothetical protein
MIESIGSTYKSIESVCRSNCSSDPIIAGHPGISFVRRAPGLSIVPSVELETRSTELAADSVERAAGAVER